MWIGLKKLRQLTYTGNNTILADHNHINLSTRNPGTYGLQVILTDFDDVTYQAVYGHFAVSLLFDDYNFDLGKASKKIDFF